MKRDRRKTGATAVLAPAPTGTAWWIYGLAALGALILVFWAYGPSLSGPFLFDDTNLIYARDTFSLPLAAWLRTDVRPVLFFTYWVSSRSGQNDPYNFHVHNVLIHFIGSIFVFLIVRRLLKWAQVEKNLDLLAAFAFAIFLLHPVQTESVAYLAGRSESLSAMFSLAAFAIFLYRRSRAVSWTVVAAVFFFFALALLSKQNAIALPAVLLLTDFWWNPAFSLKGIRANWKLYLPMAIGALAAVAFYWRIITTAETAGFGMKDLSWYQYFFTQCRALFVYLGMFLLPLHLTADWDFSISHTLLDHGAIFGLMVLLALVWIAWHWRRRFPLATYGFFLFLVLMGPTSSFVPIKDPIAERRLYLAILGLLLIVVDLLSRWNLRPKVLATACAALVLLAGTVTYLRAGVWNDPIALWEDTARKAPNKRRVRFQLAMAYFFNRQFDRAIPEFEKTAQLEKPDYNLLIDWGLAYNGLNKPEDAIAKLRQAAMLEPKNAHAWTQIAVVYATRQRWPEALDALAQAEKADPYFEKTYLYRGNVYLNQGRYADAILEYEHALQLDPNDQEARENLQKAYRLLKQQQPNASH